MQHGEELDEAVFQIAATIPLRYLKHKPYMIGGDEHFGFDPNAFVQRLIEETGISHVWKPVGHKISEGGRCINTGSLRYEGQDPNPEHEAKHHARELVWAVWKRFSPSLDRVIADSDKEQASEIVATFFADFLLDNMDLVSRVEAGFRDGTGGELDALMELERRAQGGLGQPRS